jgi:cytochrome c oxidase subunit 2
MLAGILLTLVSLWYGQNHGLLPVAASDEAALVDGLFNTMMTVSVGLFLLVESVIIIAVIKFRQRPGDEGDGPPIHGNIPLEIVWTAIPAVIVLVISVYSFEVYNELGGFDPDAASDQVQMQVAMLPGEDVSAPLIDAAHAPKRHHHHLAVGVGASPGETAGVPDLTIDVKGLQYAWIFTYPESGVISGDLHLPVGQDIKLNITAQDVLHAFWLPEFRLKQDAIPGREAELRFTPRLVGEYPVICAELCGAYHGAMVTKLYVHSQEDYDAWLQEQVAAQENGEAIAQTPIEPRTPDNLLVPYVSQMNIDASQIIESIRSEGVSRDDSHINHAAHATDSSMSPSV